jgi:hypothetical protein
MNRRNQDGKRVRFFCTTIPVDLGVAEMPHVAGFALKQSVMHNIGWSHFSEQRSIRAAASLGGD